MRIVLCGLLGHDWQPSPGGHRRACRRCYRREVLFSEGAGFGRWHQHWIKHTYPLDADPSQDPTVVSIDGYSYTLGDLHRLRRIAALDATDQRGSLVYDGDED